MWRPSRSTTPRRSTWKGREAGDVTRRLSRGSFCSLSQTGRARGRASQGGGGKAHRGASTDRQRREARSRAVRSPDGDAVVGREPELVALGHAERLVEGVDVARDLVATE